MTLGDWTQLLVLVIYGVSLALIPRVVLARRDSAVTLSWIMVLVLLPVCGILFYLAFGEARLKRYVRKRRLADSIVAKAMATRREKWGKPIAALSELDKSIVNMVTKISGTPPLPSNAVKIFTDADEATEAMLKAIAKATTSVHLETYQFKPDESGTRYLEALTAAVARGVKVRVLYDDMGSFWTRRHFFAPLVAAGGELVKFSPVNPLRELYHANLRNHRKILVVDGSVGYTGGLNIGNEYGGWRKRKFGPWRDTHMELRGPGVAPLQNVFVEDWHFATGQEIDQEVAFPEIAAAGDEWIHVLASGPESDWETIHHSIFTTITQSKNHVYLTTPYFVPDRSFRVALQTAALRGVDVRILVPAKSDNRLVDAAARYHYSELLRAGIRIFEYRKKMIHAKTVEIDGRWSTIGSANLDLRSFRLNFELNLVVYGETVAAELSRIFLCDLEGAVEVNATQVKTWSLTDRLAYASARLLEPIL